jgi:hypothetical protein
MIDKGYYLAFAPGYARALRFWSFRPISDGACPYSARIR